ncbi:MULTISPECIES: sensor histidine kinase [unclassified Pseudoalteromonas]|uniref:sensor histidine kinase n=1 Tax=unclassified Pseudoalteromonas TaxID=194690 RepID=UPI001109AA46|nr:MULTISPECIES: sensor histidine kinase [unclassified Pseudoalteromonas]TMN85031.1 sensor histidine kinase [Pseudoalteromonas sp. S410]TMN88401.1 sensor histidine kinase [Pseudoalteromonas sp. S408]TMN96738.1 sensor histidine kinase [Pseudoalteromonas sp. S407]TMN98619.1 sensor histidine kinase [Pseudoalteromonas sp. S409]TMO11432.1 sensor histidine kinase [Pseudoalteromonas sp. S186]
MSSLSSFSQQTDKTFWKYGHLIFTGFYLLPLIINFDQFTKSQMSLCLAFYIAFIILYIKAINCDNTKITPLFLALLAICFSATFFTSGTPTLYGFVAYVAGYSYTQKQRFYAALAIIVALFASSYLSDMGKLQYFLAVALILCAALFSYGIAAKRERDHKKREQESANQLEQLAAIAERERIARDLHDILGHSLSSIALKAELANKLNQGERYEQANNEIAQVADLARQLLSDVRNAVSDLKELNLVSQVAQLKQRLLEQDFNVTFNVELSVLPAKVEGIASLIIKESVTNLLRHSATKNCVITIKQTPQQLLIEVIDNAPCITLKAGNGLNGIKERAEQIQGSATFTCGERFTLNVALPISSEDLQ